LSETIVGNNICHWRRNQRYRTKPLNTLIDYKPTNHHQECEICGQTIAKGTLRIRESYGNDWIHYNNYHARCFIDSLFRMMNDLGVIQY